LASLELHSARYPPKKLSAWAKRQENAEAVEALALAAGQVIQKYSAYLKPEFIAALRSQFADRSVDDELPCTCFVWYQNANKWKQRLSEFTRAGATTEVDGITPFWDQHEADCAPAKLAGNHPPLNRSIEFHKVEAGTLIHEMIHWCTSPLFDQCSFQIADRNEKVLVREELNGSSVITGDWARALQRDTGHGGNNPPGAVSAGNSCGRTLAVEIHSGRSTR
jgi:hypothetical protein